MAQIKVLKINAEGFHEEHGASDDLTFATLTAGTQIAVTSGVTLTNNIVFNAPASDTVNGIVANNLADLSADETISGSWTVATGETLSITDAPTSGTDAANKAYVDAVAQGVDWQKSVLDRYDPTTATPSSPVAGDRYISTATANGWTADHIYEWNGSAWINTTPNEGFAVWVEDEDVIYVYNGSTWVTMSSVYNHNDLAGLQGGTSGEFYHMTSAEDTWLGTVSADIAAANVADLSDNETVTGNWSITGSMDFSAGDMVLPNAAAGTPTEGMVYWDAATDSLYVYDGTQWVNQSTGGIASSVRNNFTAVAGGIAALDAVYISANDTVSKASASASATSKAIGFAVAAAAGGASVGIQKDGVLVGVLTGATAGTPYFLSTTAGTISTARPSGSGNNIVLVGYAKNATDLDIHIQQIGVRA